MKMKEGDNVPQCVNQIKEVVSEIRATIGVIRESNIIIKLIRTLLPIYFIKFCAIKKVRAIHSNNLSLDTLVGQLTTFDLRSYDKILVTLGNSFKSSLTIGISKKEKSIKGETRSKSKDDIEAFLTRILSRGKGKFKGKLSLICFKYNEVGLFVDKNPNKSKSDRNDKKDHKYKKNKDYKDK